MFDNILSHEKCAKILYEMFGDERMDEWRK